MSDRWYTQHRQEWIAETVRIFGYINREHIQRKFGISTPQASYDLKLFMKENPGVIEYHTSAKSYVAAAPLQPPPIVLSWDDDDYRKARDCALEIINRPRHMGEKVAADVFDEAFQHGVGMLALTGKMPPQSL